MSITAENPGPTASAQADLAAVRALLEQSCDAWNRGDGAAYGELFTADATDVTYVGTVYTGGREIGRAHQALFDGFLKGSRLTTEIIAIRRHGADTAVVLTRGDVRKGQPRKKERKPGKVATYTVVREADGRWRIAAVQKTRRNALLEALSFRFQPATRPAAPSAAR
ncbi:SgcJ/EcaC family oxidoreductase [Kitasatospora sp. NBC_00240]|uniref:SgcJ/EcaC family oxidoreductase n=1 Tax=Kitasatospora sp. NBC_00240 TaxID=2903567 RepID=UPI0022585A7E|nr:SgcJ/EcaC family oxidoreductase [Kitasatospora sp. NBC_00240]MCX5211029.1 SgcJ/EcaC family oxidoreductase [Kitasatospora sp. NBC_00240]